MSEQNLAARAILLISSGEVAIETSHMTVVTSLFRLLVSGNPFGEVGIMLCLKGFWGKGSNILRLETEIVDVVLTQTAVLDQIRDLRK